MSRGGDDGFFLGLMADRRAQGAGRADGARGRGAPVPFTALALVICAALIALGVNVNAPLFEAGLPSGAWRASGGDLLVALGLVLVFAERARAAGPSPLRAALGLMSGAAGAALFVLAPGFASTALLLLSLMTIGGGAADAALLRRKDPD